MYAEGDGVPQDDLRAFEYFSRFANSHADDSPAIPQARFVANAFVALGHYYLEGIPTRRCGRPERAREMFAYAASYFGDPDAQYNLARSISTATASTRDPRQAARWLGLAANKGQYQAQALLGRMLFNGEHGVPPARPRPDVADPRPRRRRARKEPGSSSSTTRLSSRRATTSGRWR